jgi:hypothetical protein
MGVVFKCNGNVMKIIQGKMEQIQDILQETYREGEGVLGDIQSKTAWTGDAQKTMEAFLDLVVQYHRDLGNGGSTPVAEAAKALCELQDNLGGFYEEWEEWKDLNKIC